MTLTSRQKEVIQDNLRAFIANFGSIRIERADYGTGFYCFVPEDNTDFIQFCYNVDYLNGWLYGAVQAARLYQKTL